MSFRNGTDVDAGHAIKVFSSLGYKVKVANDQTVQQIQQLLCKGKLSSCDVSVRVRLSFFVESFEKFLSDCLQISCTSVGSSDVTSGKI